jgi:RNA polymerase sigma-70 factor (ECF subfamily)
MGPAGSGVRALIDAHYDSLYRYAYRLAGSTADAEDLTQETFAKAVARLPQLRDPDRAKAWLFRILRNAYLHRARSDRRHRTVSLDGVGELVESAAESSLPVDPARLQEALDELDESFRTPLILYYFEDFSYREIAEQMDLPIGTVMSRLARGKGYLRSRLAPEEPEPATGGPRRARDGM